MMTRIYVVAEGLTEERFINEVLAPELHPRDIYLIPRLIGSARSRSHRGGSVKFERVQKDVCMFLKQDREAFCTTLLDYYGMHPSFPGRHEARSCPTIAQKAVCVERAMAQALSSQLADSVISQRFLPYVQMHEFEALLFSDAEALCSALNEPKCKDDLANLEKLFPTPEEINDSVETAPSKRLMAMFPRYDKVLHGLLAVNRIGLPKIRQKCTLFNGWCEKILGLGRPE